MGKMLIIAGADFSKNAITKTPKEYDVFHFIPSNKIKLRRNFSQSWIGKAVNENVARFAVELFDLSSAIGDANRIKLVLKEGYQYVFGVGTAEDGDWYQVDCYKGGFNWSANNSVIAPISTETSYVKFQIRPEDNTTPFPENAHLEDYVEKIVVYKTEEEK